MNSICLISLPVPTLSLSLSLSRSRSVVPTRRCRPSTVSLYIPPVCSPNKRPETKIFAASSPTDDGTNTEEGFWVTGLDDPLLADVVTKKRKYRSANWAKLHVDAAIRKLGPEAAEKDPLWADLVAESKLLQKLRLESMEASRNYMLQRQMTQEDLWKATTELQDCGQQFTAVVAEWFIKYEYALFEMPWPEINEVDFWISGLEDPLLANVVTKKRKYHSAQIAKLSVDAAIRKLGAEVAEKDPLWANLVTESKLQYKLKFEYEDSKVRYVLHRTGNEMSYEDVEEKMFRNIMALDEYGQIYTVVVTKWLIKYGFLLFEVD